MRTLILMLALTAGACVQTPKEVAAEAAAADKSRAALDTELSGLTAGPPQSCINTFDTRDGSTTSFGDTLVYRATGGTRYVTKTTGCTGIGGNGQNILITRTPTTQLCRGDIATTVDRASHTFSGSCSFGDFVPYRKG
ncbi:hypothetical protein [uncultured Sphingomonas sp.]|uniref:hypothetical protein n=1 Tax=uncultured Sphingomonas sp. TaxID=158754 RepID=UPI0035CC8BA8